MNKKKLYCSVDLMKFLCAVLVVAIHTSPFKEYNKYISFGITNVLGRIAVPFFFVSAGYFFSKKYASADDRKMVLYAYIKRLLVLYIGWCAIYFVWDIRLIIKDEQSIIFIIARYIRDFIFLGGHFHLWYVPALMTGIILLYLALESKKMNTFIIASFVLYIIGLFGESYFGIIKDMPVISYIFELYFKIFVTTRNGLFFAFIYIILGSIIYQTPLNYKNRVNLFASVCLFFILIVESFILQILDLPRGHNMYLTLLPFSYFFFRFIINLDLKINKEISYMFRTYSMGIYFIHGIYLVFFRILWNYFGIENINTVNFVLVLVFSTLSLWVIKKLKIPIINSLTE